MIEPLDGEIEFLPTPLDFRIDKQALTVLAPPLTDTAPPKPAEEDTS